MMGRTGFVTEILELVLNFKIMPYKSENIKIQGTEFDKRKKLDDYQKKEIKELYESGSFSQRQLARMYGVSRRLIIFCIYPERLKANKAVRKQRGGSKRYYDKEKHTKAMRKHRKHKQKLYKESKIKLENGNK